MDDISTPLILIATGTGIAPFRSVLLQRAAIAHEAHTRAFGECWLFFGCRNAHEDFLYADELARLQKLGVITRVVTAFSRDFEQKKQIGGLQNDTSPQTQRVRTLSTFLFFIPLFSFSFFSLLFFFLHMYLLCLYSQHCVTL